MTNPDMVKKSARSSKSEGAGPDALPEANLPPPTPLPAPEADRDQVFVTHDPMDSPQHKPNIKQDKSKGLQNL